MMLSRKFRGKEGVINSKRGESKLYLKEMKSWTLIVNHLFGKSKMNNRLRKNRSRSRQKRSKSKKRREEVQKEQQHKVEKKLIKKNLLLLLVPRQKMMILTKMISPQNLRINLRNLRKKEG